MGTLNPVAYKREPERSCLYRTEQQNKDSDWEKGMNSIASVCVLFGVVLLNFHVNFGRCGEKILRLCNDCDVFCSRNLKVSSPSSQEPREGRAGNRAPGASSVRSSPRLSLPFHKSAERGF